MAAKSFNDSTLDRIAERFRLLGDPLRLRLLQNLEQREMSVADLVAATGCAQASVSKHLQLMLRGGIVKRRREGLFVYYSVTDPRVFQLCNMVCGSLTDHLTRELALMADSDAPAASRDARSRGRRLRRAQ